MTPRSQSARSRDKRPSKVNSVGRFSMGIPWSSLLTSDKSCEGKLSLLNEVINYSLDTIIPVRSIKIHETDRPWVSTQLKQLFTRRQKAFAFGNQPLFKILSFSKDSGSLPLSNRCICSNSCFKFPFCAFNCSHISLSS